MALIQSQVDELRRFYPNLALVEDGGVEFVHISPILLPAGCNPDSVEGLLCPTLRDGYSSRLFLSAQITHKGLGQHWNAAGVVIAGRRWWAVSWRTASDDLTLLGMFLDHLSAFK